MAKTSQSKTAPALEPKPDLRLFCFPHAGGNSSIFQNWPAILPATMEVRWVELPGRQSRFREPAFNQMSGLARTLAQELRPSMDVRFALFGHSMGALLAFEVARELRRANGPQPLHLFVSAQSAPQLPRSQSFAHLLPDPLFIAQVVNQTPLGASRNRELIELMLPTLRADMALCETYRYSPEPPFDCPITAMGGAQDFSINWFQLNAWRFQTTRSFNLYLFPGDHFYIQAVTPLLLRTIQTELARYGRQSH